MTDNYEPLLAALVANYHEPFNNDAQFHQAIVMISRVLPRLVDLIATDCAEQSQQRSDAMRRLRRGEL